MITNGQLRDRWQAFATRLDNWGAAITRLGATSKGYRDDTKAEIDFLINAQAFAQAMYSTWPAADVYPPDEAADQSDVDLFASHVRDANDYIASHSPDLAGFDEQGADLEHALTGLPGIGDALGKAIASVGIGVVVVIGILLVFTVARAVRA